MRRTPLFANHFTWTEYGIIICLQIWDSSRVSCACLIVAITRRLSQTDSSHYLRCQTVGLGSHLFSVISNFRRQTCAFQLWSNTRIVAFSWNAAIDAITIVGYKSNMFFHWLKLVMPRIILYCGMIVLVIPITKHMLRFHTIFVRTYQRHTGNRRLWNCRLCYGKITSNKISKLSFVRGELLPRQTAVLTSTDEFLENIEATYPQKSLTRSTCFGEYFWTFN